MKSLYLLFRLSIVVIPLFLILWPFPPFFLGKEYGEYYIDVLFQNQNRNDPSRFAAIPFVWAFISVPIAFVYFLIGIIAWQGIEYYINQPKNQKIS